MRAPKPANATVSICVTPEEANLIRDAAAVADVSVSAWAAARVAASLATSSSRREVRSAAAEIETKPLPRGSRTGRISMILQQPYYEGLKKTAPELGITAHAFAQAALLTAAEAEVAAMPAGVLRRAENQRLTKTRAGVVLVSVPAHVAKVDEDTLSATVSELIRGTVEAIMGGKGPTIAGGVAKLVAAQVGQMVTISLSILEFDLRATAFVLDVTPETLATALTIKAARAHQGAVK